MLLPALPAVALTRFWAALRHIGGVIRQLGGVFAAAASAVTPLINKVDALVVAHTVQLSVSIVPFIAVRVAGA